jgi:enoyl reductase-like protein
MKVEHLSKIYYQIPSIYPTSKQEQTYAYFFILQELAQLEKQENQSTLQQEKIHSMISLIQKKNRESFQKIYDNTYAQLQQIHQCFKTELQKNQYIIKSLQKTSTPYFQQKLQSNLKSLTFNTRISSFKALQIHLQENVDLNTFQKLSTNYRFDQIFAPHTPQNIINTHTTISSKLQLLKTFIK